LRIIYQKLDKSKWYKEKECHVKLQNIFIKALWYFCLIPSKYCFWDWVNKVIKTTWKVAMIRQTHIVNKIPLFLPWAWGQGGKGHIHCCSLQMNIHWPRAVIDVKINIDIKLLANAERWGFYDLSSPYEGIDVP
jgi:hypothetical protein